MGTIVGDPGHLCRHSAEERESSEDYSSVAEERYCRTGVARGWVVDQDGTPLVAHSVCV